MFQNTYQNGNFFQLFDPKISQDKVKNLYRITNVHGNNKIYDKLLKTYVIEFNSTTAKISFPRQQKKDLYLIQQFLVFQIYFEANMGWNIELVISDLTKTKRRVILSNNAHKVQIKPFFVKIPCLGINDGIWTNFAINLYSFMDAFKGQSYRSLDSIYITGHFKLRRIYTTNSKPIIGDETEELSKEISFLPKNYYYPPQVAFTTKVVAYDGESMLENLYEPTQMSTKNSSNFMKNTVKRFDTPKTQLNVSQKSVPGKRNFLANTNGPQMIARNREKIEDQSQQSQNEKSFKTPLSTDKNIRKKKNLVKTTQLPPKNKTSLQKKKQTVDEKKKQKSKAKAKLNPWRTNQKEAHTDVSRMQITQNEDNRNVESAQTTLFKTKNNLATKYKQSQHRTAFDRKSDHYSDSDYVELSQKFSTLTDGNKFLRSDVLNNETAKKQEEHQQIEQNIQMQTNSVYSNTNKKNEENISPNKNDIVQSICDSLQKKQLPSHQKEMFSMFARNSHYGFGQNLMRKYMGEIQRPYSPPLGQKQQAEQQTTERGQVQKQEVQLIYDPVLKCYYDHKTHTYYELKN